VRSSGQNDYQYDDCGLYISLTTDGGASAQYVLIELFMRHLFIERTVNGW
jgi:hypothetical protein